MDYSSMMYVNNQGRTIKHIALDTINVGCGAMVQQH